MIGRELGHYEITSRIGVGGMGDVYEARDTKLGRRVAIKVLPDVFARDADRVSRFEHEARVLASLNHPRIAAIHGLEEAGERKFLVMELVAGETLADRIARGPLPLDDALEVATQICEALEAAHERGVIHRDLKPANIKMTPGGQVKVLDFGLAKAFAGQPDANLSNSPTISMAATSAGIILGTAAYMSPEQARGTALDRRSDIFAFGSVLYEMLTGRPAFSGETVSDVIAAVLRAEPDWTRLPRQTPLRLRTLLHRCLAKNSKERIHDIADARIEIEAILREADSAAVTVSPRTILFGRNAAVLIFVALTVGLVLYSRGRTDSGPEMRLEITTPPTPVPGRVAISPDGQKIVFAATVEGRLKVFVRWLNSSEARPLADAQNDGNVFWSPDSRSIGFMSEGKLKRVEIDSGAVQDLTSVINGSSGGATWSQDGVILFNSGSNTGLPLYRVPAVGGESIPATNVTPPQLSHINPVFLPDEKHFLYEVTGNAEVAGAYIESLDDSETRRLPDLRRGPGDTTIRAAFMKSGYVLFARQTTLFAQPFDLKNLQLTGTPVVVAEGIDPGSKLSASDDGTIVYRSVSTTRSSTRQLVWTDRSGKEVEKVAEPDTGDPSNPALSPDGRKLALMRTVSGGNDIWLVDLGLGGLSRFTFGSAGEHRPIWSPDGSTLIFNSNRPVFDLFRKPVTRGGAEQLVLASQQAKVPMDWSSDGRFLMYRTLDPKTSQDLWVLPMTGDTKPYPIVHSNFVESQGQFSPDAKWIAYQSNESGRYEIYVQPFPGLEGKFQISTNGGAQPRWRSDGKELFYIGLDDRLMAVPIQSSSGGETLQPGMPFPLFMTRVGGALTVVTKQQQYVVSRDGQRFLMSNIVEGPASPIVVILNWKPPKD
jgi:eukaryotic-like serine/threonine-protein kinase